MYICVITVMYKLHRPYHYVANAKLVYILIFCDLNISLIHYLRHDKIFVKTIARTDTKVQQNIFLRNLCNSGQICLMNLTFKGLCIISMFQYTANKMQRYTVYLRLETALHVSGGVSTRHQEHTQLYLQYLVLVKPV